jgi:hypothetical protein
MRFTLDEIDVLVSDKARLRKEFLSWILVLVRI